MEGARPTIEQFWRKLWGAIRTEAWVVTYGGPEGSYSLLGDFSGSATRKSGAPILAFVVQVLLLAITSQSFFPAIFLAFWHNAIVPWSLKVCKQISERRSVQSWNGHRYFFPTFTKARISFLVVRQFLFLLVKVFLPYGNACLPPCAFACDSNPPTEFSLASLSRIRSPAIFAGRVQWRIQP